MSELTPEALAREQLDLLRTLAHYCAGKVRSTRGSVKEPLDAFFAIQHEIEQWAAYLPGNERPQVSTDAPPPLAGARPAPPLYPMDEDTGAADSAFTTGDTRAHFPPEPVFGTYEDAEAVDDRQAF